MFIKILSYLVLPPFIRFLHHIDIIRLPFVFYRYFTSGLCELTGIIHIEKFRTVRSNSNTGDDGHGKIGSRNFSWEIRRECVCIFITSYTMLVTNIYDTMFLKTWKNGKTFSSQEILIRLESQEILLKILENKECN